MMQLQRHLLSCNDSVSKARWSKIVPLKRKSFSSYLILIRRVALRQNLFFEEPSDEKLITKIQLKIRCHKNIKNHDLKTYLQLHITHNRKKVNPLLIA